MTPPSLHPLECASMAMNINSTRHEKKRKENVSQQLHLIRIFILYTKASMNKYNWATWCKGTREEMTDRRNAVRRRREGDVEDCELNTELNDWRATKEKRKKYHSTVVYRRCTWPWVLKVFTSLPCLSFYRLHSNSFLSHFYPFFFHSIAFNCVVNFYNYKINSVGKVTWITTRTHGWS